ncbi:FAD-dependent oxidoreductase [Stenoxybacter acetivorans]|uniref:FAD-dependent oxidoreductase n=1 Tax=Stenoxybacter acetivorans TaxID=422441 RepID=UPI00055C2A4A|nr:FAD-dependent oxidoreductase [Stenoxybacter acetivorans]
MNTPNRLPEPLGMLIDRTKTVQFQFEGKSYSALAGDSIASALWADGQKVLSRSFKYHRPRGVLTMAGQDANTLVQLPDEANVLADLTPVKNGMTAEGQNYSGSLKHDRDALLSKFSRFMPVGFYYRAFYKPRGVWQKWEPIIRKKAGLGRLNLAVKPEYYDKAYLFTDVLVIGAGPAGLQAALTAAEGGAKVLLVEQQAIIGGAFTWARFDVVRENAETQAEQLIKAVQQHPNIRIMTEATCNAWFTDNYLPIICGKRLYKVRTKTCIAAGGAFEQPAVFRNNDLPGVMFSGAAQRLMRWYAVKPGQRAVVFTANDDGYLAALDLAEQGVDVAAVVDMRSQASIEMTAALNQARIPCYIGYAVYEALANKEHTLTAVDVRRIVGKGQTSAQPQRIDCDLLCVSAGYMPAYQLLCQAGAQLHYGDARAAFSINGLPENVFIAGSVNGHHALTNVLADGGYAANRALHALGLCKEAQEPAWLPETQTNAEWPIFPHPEGKEFVDFDEDLQCKDIQNTVAYGYRDIQLVKRFSTVGMGPSQGRHSALNTARLVAEATQRSVSEIGVSTARPPFGQEKLSYLAGRSFNPYRQTAIHPRHIALGAHMMMAGAWQRPAYYGDAANRLANIEAESVCVHERVGLIDLSTLGGIELRGPDAHEMLNRMYTFGFGNLAIGRSRYALMLGEDGVLIDDGVCCRLAENHFYVTATTSGIDRVYRAMLKWNAQWRLDVDIANVTAALAVVNLAGPLSRQVLKKVCGGIDLSGEAFPYQAVRVGYIGDIPARLIRVGFVGELGYEIHVPARYGVALWDALMTAGKEEGIRPFGVETQRLLRLEKGHIIIGQDTDGMTHLGEVGMTWAIGRKKPFFIGKKTFEILEKQALKRCLVGFMLSPDKTKPLEGQLVLDKNGGISGNVTSCEYSPVLKHIIGLAYCHPEQAAEGSVLPIKVAGGETVDAVVCKTPFYDADGKRQEM